MSKLVIIGFMGSGKTTVSRLLAARLGWRAIEMDDLILARSGAPSINAIFDQQGEDHFRRLEELVARELRSTDKVVVSTGGGVVTTPQTMRELGEGGGRIVFLDASLAELRRRLQDDSSRPLFRDTARAAALYEKRLPLYRGYATFSVDTDGRTPDEVASLIETRLLAEEAK